MPVKAADVVVRAMDNFLDGIVCQNFIERIEFL
jgi:hypothetical protein